MDLNIARKSVRANMFTGVVVQTVNTSTQILVFLCKIETNLSFIISAVRLEPDHSLVPTNWNYWKQQLSQNTPTPPKRPARTRTHRIRERRTWEKRNRERRIPITMTLEMKVFFTYKNWQNVIHQPPGKDENKQRWICIKLFRTFTILSIKIRITIINEEFERRMKWNVNSNENVILELNYEWQIISWIRRKSHSIYCMKHKNSNEGCCIE